VCGGSWCLGSSPLCWPQSCMFGKGSKHQIVVDSIHYLSSTGAGAVSIDLRKHKCQFLCCCVLAVAVQALIACWRKTNFILTIILHQH
jgi:hypothetical protein